MKNSRVSPHASFSPSRLIHDPVVRLLNKTTFSSIGALVLGRQNIPVYYSRAQRLGVVEFMDGTSNKFSITSII